MTLFVGVDDVHDNCPFDENKSQANNDGDAHGDECDSDDDADGAQTDFLKRNYTN